MYIYKLFPNKYTIPKRNLEIKFIQKLYYSGKFQMFYHKAAVWGRWCLSHVFWGFMHHCASHPSGMRAKPCCTWLFVGKILELPEPHNL
jgi:ATP/ADP translocase